MTLTPNALVLLGLLLAAWTVAALWALLGARTRVRKAEAGQRHARRLARMVDESPALPLLVRADGKIEAPQRLANWLGLDAVPQYLTELDGGRIDGGGGGLTKDQLDALTEAVRVTQRTAAPFRQVVTPRGSKRSLALRGHLADPQVSPGGAALVWVFDFSDSESELVHLRDEASRAQGDFQALVGLIEAAPMPMWFRGLEGQLRLVNQAYVRAVAGNDARQVVADGIELVESVDGLTAQQVALQAAGKQLPIERMVSATINGQRRALRVSDLPLGAEGVAGYAVDVEEMEELSRSLRAFRDAQRAMLDPNVFRPGICGNLSNAARPVDCSNSHHACGALPLGAVSDEPAGLDSADSSSVDRAVFCRRLSGIADLRGDRRKLRTYRLRRSDRSRIGLYLVA